MTRFSQALPVDAREALVRVDLGHGQLTEAALLLPVAAVASVTDGTSNTILVGEYAGRFGSRSEMTCLWNVPGPLMSGFGLLLPAPAPPQLAAGNLVSPVQLLPYPDQSQPPPAARVPMAGLKTTGRVAAAGSAGGGAVGMVGLWIQPLSIIAVLIAL